MATYENGQSCLEKRGIEERNEEIGPCRGGPIKDDPCLGRMVIFGRDFKITENFILNPSFEIIWNNYRIRNIELILFRGRNIRGFFL